MGIRLEQKEMRRREILDTALHLFIRKGFAGTSVREIAREIDASPALLFHYFQSKDDILLELLSSAMKGVGKATEILNDTSDYVEKFENITHMIFSSFSSSPKSAPLFLLTHQISVSDSSPQQARELVKNTSIYEDTIRVICAGQESCKIRKGNPVALAIVFWSTIQGIAELIAMNPDCPIPEVSWIVAMMKA